MQLYQLSATNLRLYKLFEEANILKVLLYNKYMVTIEECFSDHKEHKIPQISKLKNVTKLGSSTLTIYLPFTEPRRLCLVETCEKIKKSILDDEDTLKDSPAGMSLEIGFIQTRKVENYATTYEIKFGIKEEKVRTMIVRVKGDESSHEIEVSNELYHLNCLGAEKAAKYTRQLLSDYYNTMIKLEPKDL